MSAHSGQGGIAIVGPTASGKSWLALQMADHLANAELVSIDSMQVYRGMDIGTAKPTPEEQARHRHHLLDLVDPGHDFTVAEFQAAFRTAIAGIERRNGVPVLVGGTGLYLRAAIDDLDLPPQYDEVRQELEAEPDTAALHERLAMLDPVAASRMEPTNRRRVIRALEVTIGSARPFSDFGPGLTEYAPTPYRLVGLRWRRDLLDRRIQQRYQNQLDAGFLAEVRALVGRPNGLSMTARQALGYKELLAHLDGDLTEAEAVELAVARTRRFARRQERWFRRDPRIEWHDVESDDDLERLVPRLIID
ncbi:MAG: tRNA (adenosine(37)-N6)-dimethylallyltransferase MiaA [Actinobacteria bacterium]|nr:tRNA (adenosine(37)-N6)-dimethylallyltransferase MiaA [Actinomycetota bacterium]